MKLLYFTSPPCSVCACMCARLLYFCPACRNNAKVLGECARACDGCKSIIIYMCACVSVCQHGEARPRGRRRACSAPNHLKPPLIAACVRARMRPCRAFSARSLLTWYLYVVTEYRARASSPQQQHHHHHHHMCINMYTNNMCG